MSELKNREGNRVPETHFMRRERGELKRIPTKDLFSGKKVVLFSLPGAFTPTCSSTHLPRYDELTPTFQDQGVDEVVCVSVNDAFVMEAWGKDQNVEHVTLLADGNGDFSKGMGMLVDKTEVGFGPRSWRYSMFVDDGVVKKMFIEPDKPGDPFEVSDADTMLKHLAPDAKTPAEVTIFTKQGCPFCHEAKRLLQDRGYRFEEISLSGAISYQTLRTVTGKNTAPQVFIDGKHIDGLDGLKAHFGTGD